MQNMLIHGASGAGKSMIIEKFIRSHRTDSDRPEETRPIVSMQMPALPTLRSFFSELLRSLECTVIIGSRISELEHDALRQLKRASPKLISIDEIHHLLACTPREQRAALNVLKFLSNELRVSIIALGTGEALHVMRTDPQIASRFESHALPAWTANEDLRRFLAGFLQQLDVDPNYIVGSRVAIDYILELTSGITGRIVELLRLSARCALRCQSRELSIEALREAGNEFAADLASARNVSH
jgi:Cdc6-like AAA superfamily ATPase